MRRILQILGLLIAVGLMSILLLVNLKKPDVDPQFYDILNSDIIQKQVADSFGQFGVSSADDIAYYEKDNRMYIVFGNQEFDFAKEVINDKFIGQLQDLGIETIKTDSGKFKFKYQGEWIKEIEK